MPVQVMLFSSFYIMVKEVALVCISWQLGVMFFNIDSLLHCSSVMPSFVKVGIVSSLPHEGCLRTVFIVSFLLF